LGGEADIVLSVPVQDVTAIAEAPGVEVLAVDEPRAIFLGLAQRRPDGSETPLADARVRQAVYNAVDVDTLISVILRGQGVPLAAPVARQVTGYPQSLERRPHDPERARHLLRQAGYASGVTVPLDCPNDRYINDEAICTAIAGMLERVGFDIRLRVEPGGPFTNRLFQQGESDPGIYLIGWLPSSLDSGRVLADLVAGADPARRLGVVNITGNEDTDLDALIETIQRETDMVARSEMMIDAWHRVHERTVYVPLYQQQSAWAVRSGVTVVRRADGILLWNGVRLPDGGG
jgi:peptide/nickel transport system substrate-binding protein